MDAVNATGLSTCLTAAVLIVASLAASRDGRHGMPESLAGLPGRAEHRTRAILLATPFVAGLAAAVAVGGHLMIRVLSGPAAGRFDVWEPLTAVAVAMLAATLGVAVGRWARWLVAGPMVVAALGYLIFQNHQNGPAGCCRSCRSTAPTGPTGRPASTSCTCWRSRPAAPPSHS
jgi:hypothetical protein